jgi:hypothetical protein
MKKREPFPDDLLEREMRAIEALDAAHKLPRGPARLSGCLFVLCRGRIGLRAANKSPSDYRSHALARFFGFRANYGRNSCIRRRI